MSSDAKTTTTVAEEVPVTTTVAHEPEDNASGDQGTKKVAVENAVMDDKPPTVPEEVETAKTTDTVPTDDAEGEAPKDKETDKKEGESNAESTEKAAATVPDEAAAEPLAVVDGDKDQKQPSDEGDGPKGDAATDVAEKPSDGDDKTEKTAVDKEAEVVPSDAVDSEKPATTTKEGESEVAPVAPSDSADSEKKRATTTTEGESPPSPPKKQKAGDAKIDGAPEAALAAGVVAKQAPASPSA